LTRGAATGESGRGRGGGGGKGGKKEEGRKDRVESFSSHLFSFCFGKKKTPSNKTPKKQSRPFCPRRAHQVRRHRDVPSGRVFRPVRDPGERVERVGLSFFPSNFHFLLFSFLVFSVSGFPHRISTV